ncbi:archaeosortase A, PGF-CTERM-specific [Halogranum amylolyticum]|uniref:Archaeosortase A, PGF-CTERM-specific n=1 Tax=Halogranum amylolyticum TaxID=660520 RepID=A0A1H8P9T5_9EURY|nr:archaeosortase A, PGF-CTERM-specific [Halogranum amylolyticum]
MPGPLSDALAWAVILLFGAGVLLDRYDERVARVTTAGAWVLFALFWLQLIPHFIFEHKSYIEGFLTIVAVPASVYAGWLLYRGRETLLVLSRAVAVMGLIYLPFETIPAIVIGGLTIPAPRQFLIQAVADQTGFLMGLFGYHPEVVMGTESGYPSAFLFQTPEGHRLHFEIVLACTGLGSIAIFAGLIGAVKAPLERKLRALAIAVPVIYALNLARTTFIGITFGNQSLQFFVDEVLFMFGSSDPYMVSWFISDRIISQVLAVFVLVGLTYVVVRELPELLTVIEDVLYMATKKEYDLQDALDLRVPRADGGERVERFER